MAHYVHFSQAFQDKMSPSVKGRSLLALTNEFRNIKRVLLKDAFHDPSAPKNRIMVTSVHQGAGRTFLAYNLARSVALEQDKTVLLVNADVSSPEIDRALIRDDIDDKDQIPGLIDYLVDVTKALNEVLCHTNVDNLKVIPCGRDHYLANELLSGNHMAQLMTEFQSRYPDRVVIFDAPPLLDISEAATLSQYVDQLIVVVQDGVTSISDLQRLSEQLPKDVKVHYLLNRAKSLY